MRVGDGDEAAFGGAGWEGLRGGGWEPWCEEEEEREELSSGQPHVRGEGID